VTCYGLQPRVRPVGAIAPWSVGSSASGCLGCGCVHHPRIIDLGPAGLPMATAHTPTSWFTSPQRPRTIPRIQTRLSCFSRHGQSSHACSSSRRSLHPSSTGSGDAEASDRNSRAGSSLGTMIDGPITGHEFTLPIRPCTQTLPWTAPRFLATWWAMLSLKSPSIRKAMSSKPKLSRRSPWIDEKIEATLRRWHYQPATLDGTPVASRHDVHFHFPS